MVSRDDLCWGADEGQKDWEEDQAIYYTEHRKPQQDAEEVPVEGKMCVCGSLGYIWTEISTCTDTYKYTNLSKQCRLKGIHIFIRT